jgi:hypothetical protein
LWNFHSAHVLELFNAEFGQGIYAAGGEKYRELARECLRVASTTITAENRSHLVEMARVWSRSRNWRRNFSRHYDAFAPTTPLNPTQESLLIPTLLPF